MGIRLLSHAEQTAQHLRDELRQGRWGSQMPGVLRLERELGVNRNTLEAALHLLEKDGWLVAQGAGKRRKIVVPESETPASLRVAMLYYESNDAATGYIIDLLHRLGEAGHARFSAGPTLVDLGMKPERVARLVRQTEADAWIIVSGSREILEWFAGQSVPALALFGRRRGLPIAAAGPEKPPAMAALTRRLIELGHRRISLLARRERRLPTPGETEQVFLDELSAGGVPSGTYNLPDWSETVAGFHRCLDSLLKATPPTAIIVDEAPFFTAAMQHLARRGIRVPEDVSLVCCDADPHFEWCDPPVSHIRWDPKPVVKRIVRWADRISRGKTDHRQSMTRAEFIEGGTVGPVPR